MIEADDTEGRPPPLYRKFNGGQSPTSKLGRKRRKRRKSISSISTTNCRYDMVRYTAQKFGMKEAPDTWNVFWTDLSISVQRCKEMKRYQRINHFPGMLEICRKDLLARNLNRLYRAFPTEYDVFPKTWCLPADIADIVEYVKTHRNRCFIVKPDLGCQGRGISITKNVNQLKNYDKMICQLYIQRPFLIDGFKFDLRIYALITSCDPLRIFVYNEGLARFATLKYKEPNGLNANNMYIHLTNYSVNKHSRTYVVDDIDGSKRKLSTINRWFIRNNYDVKKIWDDIDDVIVKTFIVSLPTLRHYYHTCFPNHSTSYACFELLGFDLMFDYRLKPYVLEVNHSPSFHTDTTIDHEVKESLLYDTFNILNLFHNCKSKILTDDKRRAKDRLFNTSPTLENVEKSKSVDDHITQSRIEWEDEHLGNYRKIYPGRRDRYYDQFIGSRQSSMYGDTLSSKAKEVASKITEETNVLNELKEKERKEKEQKEKELKEKELKEKEQRVKPVPRHRSLDAKRTVDESMGDKKFIPPKRKPSPLVSYEPCPIDESDERQRLFAMEKREILIKSRGVIDQIRDNLRNAGLLRLEDEIKFGRSDKWENVVGSTRKWRPTKKPEESRKSESVKFTRDPSANPPKK